MPASLGAVLVSILICSRDRADSLKATLESLGQVSFCGHTVEVVLVDNGSSDHTREVIAGWVPGEVTKQAVFLPGAGKAAALNEAVARSRGEILVFTDDDVRFEAGWLEQLVRPIVEGLAAATTGAIRIPGDLNRPWLVDGFPAFVAANEVSRNGVITGLVGANMACTRRVFSELGGFDAELGPGALGFGEDSLFGWRILAAGGSIQWLPGAVVWHHFDSSRLALRSLVRTAVRMGRSEAYLHHHWHQRPLLALAALVPRALRLTGALLAKRYFGPPGWTGSGTPEYWILPLVATWSYLVQRLRESGRPRKYAPGCPADRV